MQFHWLQENNNIHISGGKLQRVWVGLIHDDRRDETLTGKIIRPQSSSQCEMPKHTHTQSLAVVWPPCNLYLTLLLKQLKRTHNQPLEKKWCVQRFSEFINQRFYANLITDRCECLYGTGDLSVLRKAVLNNSFQQVWKSRQDVWVVKEAGVSLLV